MMTEHIRCRAVHNFCGKLATAVRKAIQSADCSLADRTSAAVTAWKANLKKSFEKEVSKPAAAAISDIGTQIGTLSSIVKRDSGRFAPRRLINLLQVR